MALVVDNNHVLDVFFRLWCVSLYIDYLYSAVLDVTLNIRYMLWNVYVMLAERQVVVLLWRSIFMLKKKKKRVVTHAHLYCSIVFNISFSLSEFEMIIVFKKIIVQTVSDLDDELHVWWWDFWIAGAYDEDSERLDMKIEKIRDTWWNNVGPLQLEGIWWSGK
jgi:hypothetical protein